MTDLIDLAVETQTCPRCKALPGDWCTTTRGRHIGSLASHIHEPRVHPLWTAYWRGWDEACEEQVYRVNRGLPLIQPRPDR